MLINCLINAYYCDDLMWILPSLPRPQSTQSPDAAPPGVRTVRSKTIHSNNVHQQNQMLIPFGMIVLISCPG